MQSCESLQTKYNKGSITPSIKKNNQMTKEERLQHLQDTTRQNLALIGEDPEREGLIKTPERVAKAILSLTQGYEQDPIATLNSAKFAEDYDKMVLVKDIEFYSLCEHHLLPFFGKVHVAYIPNGYITGLSKIPRVVNIFARRLQVQERLTQQICECIQDALNPKGVMVMIEAQHLCMQMRGVEKQGSITCTTDYCGCFEDDATLRQEFLSQIKG